MDLKPSVLPLVIDQIFGRLEQEFASKSKDSLSKTDLLELSGIFGNDLELAFNIIDRDRLIVYRTEKLQRKFIEVAENKETTYKLFPNVNYCMCADFQSRVIDKSEAYTCRHVLAAKLSQFFSTIREQIVADDIFKSLIESIAAD